MRCTGELDSSGCRGKEMASVSVQAEAPLVAGVCGGTMPELEFVMETAPFLYAPVTAGQQVGTWCARQENGHIAATGALYAAESISYQTKQSVSEQKPAWHQRLWHMLFPEKRLKK